MERSIEIATGESVAFSYELAGLGSRFFALFIDMAIQLLTLVLLFAAFVAYSLALPGNPKAHETAFTKTESAILIALVSFVIFMIFFGYFILFEWLWGGRTPGKILLGMRVVRDGGFPLDFTSSAIRNTVRMVEFALGFYLMSAISALMNPYNRRLGDLAAGTLVVRSGRYERAKPVTARELAGRVHDDPVLADLSDADRALIRNFAGRVKWLNATARRDLASRIAATVRPRLPAGYGNLSDIELLEFLASRE